MDFERYLINISYVAPDLAEMSDDDVMEFTSGYSVASAPELRLSATGSTHTEALANLLEMTIEDHDYPLSITSKNW